MSSRVGERFGPNNYGLRSIANAVDRDSEPRQPEVRRGDTQYYSVTSDLSASIAQLLHLRSGCPGIGVMYSMK